MNEEEKESLAWAILLIGTGIMFWVLAGMNAWAAIRDNVDKYWIGTAVMVLAGIVAFLLGINELEEVR